ncbi:MAG: single-stranded DNA-binding protein [Oscillospiraceae bacterium]
MDEIKADNLVELRGTLAGAPVFSHESRGERFFTFPVETTRLSGAVDRLNVVAREAQLVSLAAEEEPFVHVIGELRSFNNKRGEGSRLIITVFARELTLDTGEEINSVALTGALCKPPNLRTTPMGRDICDLMLAVGRRYGRSDYLPCICWGLRARDAVGWNVGDRVTLRGRIQSRQYIKLIDGEAIEKTAFEVSVVEISKA